MHARAVRFVVGVAAVTAAAAACAPAGTSVDEPTAAATTVAPLEDDVLGGIAVSVAQARLDRERRVVQVRVANGSAVDVTVVEARLTTPGAAGVAISTRGRAVRSGVDRDLSVALGAPRCDGAAAAAGGTTAVELDLVDDDGRTGAWRGTPDDPNGVLARIHREDCAAAAVASGARLSLDPHVTVGDPGGGGRLTGSVTLRLEPVPGGPRVEVVRVDGTTLLTPLGGAASWPLALDSAAGSAEVTLTFEPARRGPDGGPGWTNGPRGLSVAGGRIAV
ncbi:hypothetical protein ACT17Q_02340 [Cellulomonas sp. CW35]|uniref:hypothetical protein n=1 Tax=Cellulomonas sp. CW35 TaxID=3458249 RepID=UPI0040343D51